MLNGSSVLALYSIVLQRRAQDLFSGGLKLSKTIFSKRFLLANYGNVAKSKCSAKFCADPASIADAAATCWDWVLLTYSYSNSLVPFHGQVPRRLPGARGRAHVRPRGGDAGADLPRRPRGQRRRRERRGTLQGQGKEQVRRGRGLHQPKLQP